MAKLSPKKRSARPKKDAGCMWGLINLFDFRQVQHTPRLLPDNKRGNIRQTDAGNGYSRISLDPVVNSLKGNDADTVDEGRVENVNLASVKTLMEEEMSQDSPQDIVSNDKAQQVSCGTGNEVQVKKNKIQGRTNAKIISDACVNDPATGPDNHQFGSSIDISTLNMDLATFLIKFYSHGYQLQHTHIDRDDEDGACTASEMTSETENNHLDEPDSLLNEKQIVLKKALADLTRMISSQSHSDEKASNGSAQSYEFLDILNTLKTNKESFLKILENPDSPFLKQFQDIQNNHDGKISKGKYDRYPVKIGLSGKDWSAGKVEDPDGCENLHKQSRYNFFWKHKSKVTVPSQGKPSPQTQNRIVVLKPNPNRIVRSALIASTSSSPRSPLRLNLEDNPEKAMPFFSLTEMKRRIKNMFGDSKKARRAISMDGILHKIPIGSKDPADTDQLAVRNIVSMTSARKISFDAKVPLEAETVLNKKGKQSRIVESEPKMALNVALPRFGNVIYEEGRKHLAQILEMVGDQRDKVTTARISKPLGRILSLPEYAGLSIRPSSESELDIIFSPRYHKLISPRQNYQENASSSSSVSKQNLLADSCSNRAGIGQTSSTVSKQNILHHELQTSNSKVELFESHKLDDNLEGTSGLDISDMMVVDKVDATSSLNDYHVNVASELYVGEEESLKGPVATNTVILCEFAPSSLPEESISSPLCPTGKPGRKSPPSVLERFYSEDVSNPEWTTGKHSRHQLKPRQLSFEDDMLSRTMYSLEAEGHSKTYFGDKRARLAYIKAVLEASQLSTDEHSESWYWADQLLGPSLFEELKTSSYQLQDDPRLLFDCISEILSEIQERHYNLPFMTQCVRPTPVGPNLISEVSTAVERCLRTVLPNTVNHIIKRDLYSGTWTKLGLEIEDMVIDIWDTLLDDLMEEAVFDLWLFDM